jgi:hypothetical protein
VGLLVSAVISLWIWREVVKLNNKIKAWLSKIQF